MSGTTFLEEILSWDEKKRTEKMEEALPRLISYFSDYTSHEEAVGILHILCQSFIPMVQHDQLEEKVFSKIKQQVCHLLDNVIADLHQAVSESEGQKTDCQHLLDLLQHIVNIVQGVEHCVRHMATVSNLYTCHVRSLMPCTFHILKGLYHHCQESSILYGDNLPFVSESLSCIFRAAHSLQMSVLNIVDKLSSSCTDMEQLQDVQDIAVVCDSLLSLCRLVACLDLKLTISLWKALSRLAGTQPDVYHEHIDLSGMMCYLCEEISTGVSQLLQSLSPVMDQAEETLSQGDEKMLLKSVKILNFQIKVLVSLVRDFHDYLQDCMASIHQILLQLSSVLPPCRFEGRRQVELCQQLWSAALPAVQYLLNNAAFINCVLNAEGGDEGRECAQLMLQVMIMDGIAGISVDLVVQWLDTSSWSSNSEPYSNLLTAAFASLHKCHVEVCLPVYLACPPCGDQPERLVSVYQYAIDHICAFIASCPSEVFHIIEQSLLESLLGSNPISSQAAQDCWCFLARCGPVALCWQHTQQIMTAIIQVNSQGPDSSLGKPLTSLLRRLVKLLPAHYQRALVQLMPPADHLGLWCEMGVACLMDEVAGEVSNALLAACLTCLQQLAACPSSSTTTMVPALQCLHNILQNSACASVITPQQGALLLNLLSALWTMIPPDQPLFPAVRMEAGVIHHFLGALLSFTSDLVDQLDAKLLLHVMVVSIKLLTIPAPEDLCSVILHFMQVMGPIRIPACFEQGLILRKMGEVFSRALHHESAWVQYMALEAFTNFAQHTPHEAVVPQCLAQDGDLQDKVAAFLNKVPSPAGHKFDTAHFLQQQHQCFAARTCRQLSFDKLSDSSSEPQCKRQKLENSTDPRQPQDSYQTVVDELQTLTQRLEKLQASGPIPDWVVDSTKPLLQRMALCLAPHNNTVR